MTKVIELDKIKQVTPEIDIIGEIIFQSNKV
jgi:hypothetical protein